VQRLSGAGFGPLVQGLIDHDRDNPAGGSIFVLERYCHENYLLDPLVVYSALLNEERG